MGQVEIAAGYDRGWLRRTESVYLDAQEAEEADYLGYGIWSNQMEVGQRHSLEPSRYSVRRAIMTFNTSVLPSYANITAAWIHLYCWQYLNDNDWDVVIVRGDFDLPPVIANYHDLLNETVHRGSLSALECSSRTLIPLNSTGIADINKSGNTLFALRSSRDIYKNAPSYDTNEYIRCSHTVYWTRLRVEYEFLFSPGYTWVEGDRLHYIDYYAGERYIEGTTTGDTGAPGHIWIEETHLHYTDSSGNERSYQGVKEGVTGRDKTGYIWVGAWSVASQTPAQYSTYGARLYYIDGNGDERYIAGIEV